MVHLKRKITAHILSVVLLFSCLATSYYTFADEESQLFYDGSTNEAVLNAGGAVIWSDEKYQKEQEEKENAKIVDYDQRSFEVGPYMDEVNYLLNSGSVVKNYKTGTGNSSMPNGYTIPCQPGQTIEIIDEANPDNLFDQIFPEDVYCTIYNLIPNHVYDVYVYNDQGVLLDQYKIRPVGSVRFIKTDYVANLRDMGGWEVPNGIIKYGKLYRGAEIPSLASKMYKLDNDLITLSKLNIGAEVDLRTDEEAYQTKRWNTQTYGSQDISQIPGASYVQNTMQGYMLGINFGRGLSDKTVRALRTIIEDVNEGTIVYFHCAAGADRTGTIAFMIEGLLGVSENDMDKDYELTTFADTYRYRTYDGYVEMKDYIKSLEGDTLQQQFYNWFLQAGFTDSELQNFIANMTEYTM